MKHGSKIFSTTYSGADKPGVNFTPFYITFEDNWLKDQHTVMSPNGVQARVMQKLQQVGAHYLATLQLISVDPAEFCPISELTPGTSWVMVGGAGVSESFSMGNESNVMAPGKIKNQISVLRKSYRYGGNLQNKYTEIEFNIEGKKTKRWMPFEEWQHMLNWKETCEEHYWYSKYNRLADGTIPLKDYVNGLPIPFGAGVD